MKRMQWVFFDDTFHMLRRGWWGLMVAVIVVSVVGALTGSVVAVESHTCSNKAHHLHLDHSFDAWAGCFVIINGKQIPVDAYRATDQVSR